MKRQALNLLTALALTTGAVFGTSACGASLATILATAPGVVDAILKIVGEVEIFLSPQLDDAGKAELQKIADAIRDTGAMLKAAADGTASMTEGQVTAAFDRLEDLYKQIVAFGKKYGVRYAADGRMSAAPGVLAVPRYEDVK